MTSDSMLVRFAVPEAEILGFSAGTEVRVRSRDSESWLKAVVVGSDPFPLKAREWSGDALRSDAEARLFVVFARIEKANELPDGATLEVTR